MRTRRYIFRINKANHFCFFYNEKRGDDSLYYIYTERENDNVGIKFVVNVQKNKGDSDAK